MSDVLFMGVGDVGPVHGPADGFPLEQYAELARPVLATADLRFANCERQYSNRGVRSDESPHGRQPPEMAQVFSEFGFHVLSLANNHMYDYGPDALLDTRALMLEKGFAVAGAGKDLAEARKAAIVETNGVKVGFLSYCSFLPPDGAAGESKPGMAPLRVTAKAELRGPHSPARVLTEADPSDLAMLLDDIRALKKQTDVVALSIHWGVPWVPRVISDYQVQAAHACVDAGVDLILGHHAHVPKGIEVYKGKTVFYSLSNFCMTKAYPHASWDEPAWAHGALRNHADLDHNLPLLPYGVNAKRSLIAKATFSKTGISDVSWLPVIIDAKYRPEVIKATDPRFDDMVRYLDWASDGFNHKFTVRGDEVIVSSS